MHIPDVWSFKFLHNLCARMVSRMHLMKKFKMWCHLTVELPRGNICLTMFMSRCVGVCIRDSVLVRHLTAVLTVLSTDFGKRAWNHRRSARVRSRAWFRYHENKERRFMKNRPNSKTAKTNHNFPNARRRIMISWYPILSIFIHSSNRVHYQIGLLVQQFYE